LIKIFSIDEIIEEAYERIGLQANSGYDIKAGEKILEYYVPGMGQ
jgi:hypothetical protein